MELDTAKTISHVESLKLTLQKMGDETKKVMGNAQNFRDDFDCEGSRTAYELTQEITRIIEEINKIIEKSANFVQEGAEVIKQAEDSTKNWR